MSLKDVVFFAVIILGVILFLYGSNYYDSLTGWTGVFLMVGGVLAEIILGVYESLRKREG